MTNSAAKSARKKKGLIRWNAIVPIATGAALVGVYFTFFFDLHLRKVLEWSLGSLNSAEVNIASLRTRVVGLSLDIQGVAFTSPAEPSTNRLGIGSISARLNGDALLRAKLVIEELSVRDLESGTPRTTPGRVYPPLASNPDTPTGKLLARIKEEAALSGVGQLAAMLQGFDPREALKNIGSLDSLQSLARIKALETDLAAKQATWRQTLTTIPGQKELDGLQAKVAAIKIGGNPAELQGQIGQATSVLGEARTVVDGVRSKGTGLVQDVTGFSKSLTELDDLVAKDRQQLAGRLKLPQVDSQALTRQLLGERVIRYVAQTEQFIKMGRSQAGSGAGKRAAPPVQAGIGFKGVNYEFGRLRGYPAVWLKRAEVTSKGGNSAFGGDVAGVLTDWSSDARIIQKPAVARLSADFPRRGIEGLRFEARLDRSREPARDHVELTLGGMPLAAQTLSESAELELSIPQSKARAKLEGSFEGEGVLIEGTVGLKDARYRVASRTPLMQQLVQEATQNLSQASIGVRVSGTWNDLRLSLTSSLGDALERAFRSRVEKQVVEVRQKIDALIQERVGKPRQALTEKFGRTQSEITGQVDARQKQADGVAGQAQGKVDQAKAQLQNAGTKKAVDAVRGKLPF